MKPTEELAAYIESEIIPRYTSFDKAHRIDHVRTVIRQSLCLAAHYEVDTDMVYTIAAYHDTGLVAGRQRHHLVSGEILMADTELHRWFSEPQLLLMREAIEDHRASSEHEPRTIYGRIVAEADRCIDAETILRRTVQYGLAHYPELDRLGHYLRCRDHLARKYAEGGYLRLWIPQSENTRRLAELRRLVRDKERLRMWFDTIYEQETDPRREQCARKFREKSGCEVETIRAVFAFRTANEHRDPSVQGFLVNGESVIDRENFEIHSREVFYMINDLDTPCPD